MAQQKNILLITTDQQRFDTIHAHGNPHILTPHLNWLADSGISFTRCYSDAPVCIAARATILTGRHGYNQKLVSNTDPIPVFDPHLTLPGILSDAGYQTKAVGKMHFSPERRHNGFQHMEILADYYRYMARHPQFGVPADHGVATNEFEPAISTVPESHSLTHWTVDRSIDFLETRDDTRPFFLWTSFSKPHAALDPCLPYWLLYQNREVPAPVYGNWSQDAGEVPLGLRWPTLDLGGIDRFSRERILDTRRAYYACITQIDYNLGLLFARLREMDLFENTTVIFTSDHGDMLGDHHLGSKSVFLEGSAHVPMIVRPAKNSDLNESRGERCDALACLADLLPTCLQIAGASKPADADGHSLTDLFKGKAKREHFFGECGFSERGGFHCVLNGRYKYLFTSLGGGELLFDLKSDPYEKCDLSKDPGAASTLNSLREKLTAHLRAREHPAAKNGKLVSTAKPPSEQQMRANAWPGFYSRQNPEEVLH